MRHRSLVTTETTGQHVRIDIRCDVCDGGSFTIARAHLETLARVLPKICDEVGIDLDDGLTETHVFDLSDEANRKAAEAMYQDFLRRRKATDPH